MTTAVTPAGGTAAKEPYRLRWAGLAVLCLSLLIVVMANTSLIVAAPGMLRDLQLTSADMQWIIDGYTVPYAALMLLFGVLGDRYGRRRALLAGLIAFAAGAVYGSFADSAGDVIVARIVMGVGAAVIMPATLSLLVAMFPVHERARAIAAWAATSGLAIALGPLLAGWLLESNSWGSTFLINVPIAALAAIAALILVPASKADDLTRTDWVGGALSVAALGGIVYTIIEGFHFGWGTGVIATSIGSVVAAVLFVGWELRHPRPLLDVRRVADRTVGGACMSVLLLFLVAFGAIYFVAQQFQFVLGYGPLETGLRLLPLAATVSLGAALSGRLAPRLGARILVGAGMIAAAAGILTLTVTDGASGFTPFLISLLLLGLGIGLATPPSTDLIMGGFPDSDLGAAGGLNDTAVEFGGSLGIAVLGSILATTYHREISGFLDGLPLANLPGPMADQAAMAIEAAGDSVGGAAIVAEELAANPFAASYAQPLLDALSAAFAQAISSASLVAGIVLLVGAAAVTALLPRGLHTRARSEAQIGS
ncbi:drug resistance transporter, EmrB/QacA subfamily [Rhodococcus rhodochrous J3]|uniref:Drug resistance transporter, EmrB/QacA subfamily n=1 Tax=Rhodococcus rhodochrous J3 TaxID=903528 RepID=A0ABY1M716_RHORH|nr:MFS transporter [Rhodococcus rhodochrous]SMG19695.1 drug resistance transporter, EmrB/QacA subfamily [Rhodococcus rhodochrous J3]